MENHEKLMRKVMEKSRSNRTIKRDVLNLAYEEVLYELKAFKCSIEGNEAELRDRLLRKRLINDETNNDFMIPWYPWDSSGSTAEREATIGSTARPAQRKSAKPRTSKPKKAAAVPRASDALVEKRVTTAVSRKVSSPSSDSSDQGNDELNIVHTFADVHRSCDVVPSTSTNAFATTQYFSSTGRETNLTLPADINRVISQGKFEYLIQKVVQKNSQIIDANLQSNKFADKIQLSNTPVSRPKIKNIRKLNYETPKIQTISDPLQTSSEISNRSRVAREIYYTPKQTFDEIINDDDDKIENLVESSCNEDSENDFQINDDNTDDLEFIEPRERNISFNFLNKNISDQSKEKRNLKSKQINKNLDLEKLKLNELLEQNKMLIEKLKEKSSTKQKSVKFTKNKTINDDSENSDSEVESNKPQKDKNNRKNKKIVKEKFKIFEDSCSSNSSSEEDSDHDFKNKRKNKNSSRKLNKTRSKKKISKSHSSSDESEEEEVIENKAMTNMIRLLNQWKITFSGEDKADDPEEFLEQLNDCRKSSNIKDDLLIKALPTVLSKRANRWFRTIRDELTSWRDFKEKFRHQFIGVYDKEDLLDDLRRRTQGKNEKIDNFLANFKYIVSKFSYKPSRKFLVETAYRNLLPAYRKAMSDKVIETLDDIIKYGRLKERQADLDNRYSPPPPADKMRVRGAAYIGSVSGKYQVAALEESEVALVAAVQRGNKKDTSNNSSNNSSNDKNNKDSSCKNNYNNQINNIAQPISEGEKVIEAQ